MREDLSADLALAAELGGEMGRRFSSFDWASHPLGPPQDWSPGARVVVAMALTSRFPIVLWLGERLFLIYNDAYLPVLGQKHPAGLVLPARRCGPSCGTLSDRCSKGSWRRAWPPGPTT